MVVPGGGRRRPGGIIRRSRWTGAVCSTCEAAAMYFRPASSAQLTASASGCFERTLASFTSIGRFTPAITSMPCRCIMEIARLDGVPPNMSVSTTTPSPVSHRLIHASISARRFSMSSSGPMQTVSTFRCEPTTCSMADRNSSARRPWVTRTMPIIGGDRLPRWRVAFGRSCRGLRPPVPEPARLLRRVAQSEASPGRGASRSVR